MAFTPEQIEANRRFFAAKLAALRQKTDVVKRVTDGTGDFILLDVRPRAAFRKAHVKGAWCVPLEELPELLPRLPRDRELVTYCWSDY